MPRYVRAVWGLLASVALVLTGAVVAVPPAHGAAVHHSALFDSGWPHAAAPGQRVGFTAKFVNTRYVPDVLKFRSNGWCWDKSGAMVTFKSAWKNVTVPPVNPKGGGGTITVTGPSAVIPKTCVFYKFLYDISGYTASVELELAPRSSATATGAVAINFNIFKLPYTSSNYRFNLELKAPKPAYSVQAHHTLPQTFQPQWDKLGINWNNPKYLRWWCSKKGLKTNHSAKAAAYNKLWRDYFIKHPKASKTQVLAYRTAIQVKFKYTC